MYLVVLLLQYHKDIKSLHVIYYKVKYVFFPTNNGSATQPLLIFEQCLCLTKISSLSLVKENPVSRCEMR